MIKTALGIPDADDRPIVFYCWNAALDHERLAGHIAWFKKVGLGGFIIMPLMGLPYAVLAEPWLRAVEFALEKAKALGLHVWIWDEWIFPSGMGGGLVTENPEFRARKLHLAMDVILEPGQSLSFTAPEKCIAAGVVGVNNKYNLPEGEFKPIPVKAGGRIEYRAGERRERLLLVTWVYSSAHETSIAGIDDSPQHFSVDMLNPAATRRFIEVIHAKHQERFKSYFGNTLKGFFYDEPTQAFPFPWTDDFADRFLKMKGYDIRPRLPLMVMCLSYTFTQPCAGGAVRAIRKLADDYFDVWTDCVAESFYGELERWCHDHGVLSIGHQDMDHRLQNLGTVSGHFFKDSARNDYPGIDVISAQIVPGRFDDFPRYAGSAARVLGKKHAMSESLADMGYGMHMDAIRYVLEHQVIRGVTRFFLSRVDHDPKPAENLWAPELSPRNPIMDPFAPILNERIGRLSRLMNTGMPSLEVGLYVPMHDISAAQLLLAHPHAGNNSKLPWESVDQLAEFLAYLPCEFDYLWAEAFAAMELAPGGFKSKYGQVYRTIIIPYGCTPPEKTLRALHEFVAQGGKLLTSEWPPNGLQDVAVNCHTLKEIEKSLPLNIRLESSGARISASGRKGGDWELFLLLNEDDKKQEVAIDFKGPGRLLEIDLSNGRLNYVTETGPLRAIREFDATELMAFIVDKGKSLKSEKPLSPAENPLPLASWEIDLPNGKTELIKDNMPDWKNLGFPNYSGWITYRTQFNCQRKGAVMRLNLGEVCYGAEVRLDGRRVAYVPFRPYRVMLRDLATGMHTLEVRVLNTLANQYCEKPLVCSTYIRDIKKTRSGLFGPINLTSYG